MNKRISLTAILLSVALVGCAGTKQPTELADSSNLTAEKDILLNDNGNVTDQELEQAQHIDIQVRGNGRVVITGVQSPSGKVEDHELSEKDSKELLAEIVKASRGGDKTRLSALVQDHVAKLQGL